MCVTKITRKIFLKIKQYYKHKYFELDKIEGNLNSNESNRLTGNQ